MQPFLDSLFFCISASQTQHVLKTALSKECKWLRLRIQAAEINPHTYGQSMTKKLRIYNGERQSLH